MTRVALVVLVLSTCGALSAAAQPPDSVLVNGKIVTLDALSSVREALAIRDGKITAVGDNAEIRQLAAPTTRVFDLGGRTVIPGLIDSHLHAIRAALSFTSEVNWIGTRSLPEALARISAAAHSHERGAWLIVAGGWNELQFAERRRPTQAELEAAAPGSPVYVQLGYGWALLTDAGFAKLNINGDADLPAGGKLERDAAGKPTGAITGGNNLFPSDYQPVFDVWRRHDMTVRIAYSFNGQTAGHEKEELAQLTELLQMGSGDEYLKFNGIGERITLAMNNNPAPSDADKERYYEIAKWAAERGFALTMHWGPDATVDHLLGIFERVNREVPIAGLRWSIAHLNDASEKSLARMAALGVGWTVQDAMYFGGDALVRAQGPDAGKRIPPVMTGKRLGVAIGAGTDAHRVASYNPFTALQWFADGKTVGGLAIRGPDETPSREDALRFYTLGSAWFSHDEDKRGSLEVGKLADLAVLSADYLTVPVEQIGRIESELTMLGGKPVWSVGPFATIN